jgi:hypothetical protein
MSDDRQRGDDQDPASFLEAFGRRAAVERADAARQRPETGQVG